MARLIFMALLAVLVFTMLPSMVSDWLVSKGYMERSATGTLLQANDPSEISQDSQKSNLAGVHRTVLKPGPGGHYFAQAHFNHKSVRTMIDTGASFVGLTYEDARRLGIKLVDSDYTIRVQTANGVLLYARSRVNSIRIGQVQVRNVDVLVAPKGALNITLMGMSYLKKLKTFKIERGRLILES